MGMNVSTYVGEYIKANLGRVKYEDVITSCMNVKCSNHGSKINGNFCSKCGAEISSLKVIKEDDMSLYDIVEKFNISDDLFYEPEGHNVILPNSGGTYLTDWDDQNEVNLIGKVPNESEIFSSPEMKKLLDALDILGIKYEKCFGAVQYWS